MPQPKDKDWLNGYKNKTPTYVVYKRPTSKQGTHADWKWRAGKRFSMQIGTKRVLSNESAVCIRCPKCWSFSISPFNEYSGLIPFKIGWFDLLAVQGTLKSLLQHQCEGINFSALCCLYGPALTMIFYYWKDHSFDCMDLCWQSDVSAFQHTV